MAVAGLHNLSAFGPFFGEPQSPVSRQWDDEPATPSSRASSLLQMWRELEGDNVVSLSHRLRVQSNGSDFEGLSASMSVGQRIHNGHDNSEDVDESENQAITGSEADHNDNNSIISEQSSDLGEIERERVRQIFREWRNSGSMSHSSNGFHLNNRSGPQWLGDNECERVRIIRELVQMNSQQRNNQGSVRDGGAEAGSQIDQVCNGLVITHPEIGARRPIRRLCGRQTLVDLLQRAQCERKEELHGLSEQRPVSDFTHRNRIQALLRGRFLRNERLISDKRPSSAAATELGLLRQRHTVSGLREGFLSKLENSASTSVNSSESDSSLVDQNDGESGPTCRESEMTRSSATSDLESAAEGAGNQQEFVREATEVEDSVVHNVEIERNVSLENEGPEQVSLYNDRGQRELSLDDVGNAQSTEERVLEGEATRDGEDLNASITNELPGETEDMIRSGSHGVFGEHYELRSSVGSVNEATAHTAYLEGNIDEPDWRDASAQVDEFHESVTETEESAWQQLSSVALTEWVDGGRESTARSGQESSANQLFRETLYNDAVEQDQMQESHDGWPSHDFQEAIDSWLDMPSGEVGASVRRVDTFYFADVDNVHSMELQELFSRRRVYSLLRSSFRESLDQVLQSHVERQGHTSGDWELDDGSSSPSLLEQDQAEQNGDRASNLSDAADGNLFAPTSTFVTASPPLWDGDMQGSSLPHNNLNRQLGMEWEVVNELRTDMARLQQRLNNMQSMLEQCMDMQIELQRAVQQEVSAALNRSILTRDASKGNTLTLHDESQWDYVRRGICCLCHDSNIDSLLYRCGHMCTCSNCAEKLIQDTGKCPMCWAPAVEAVRAYFTQ